MSELWSDYIGRKVKCEFVEKIPKHLVSDMKNCETSCHEDASLALSTFVRILRGHGGKEHISLENETTKVIKSYVNISWI